MSLTPPKKTSAGYFMAIPAQTPIVAPTLRWESDGKWSPPTSEWSEFADRTRKTLLGEILSHGNWFSRPPRHDLIDPLFSPWVVKTSQGESRFFCSLPATPGVEGSTGEATLHLQGLIMTATAIAPVWKVDAFIQDEMQDTISLFGDAETVDGSVAEEGETREIQLDEIEYAPDAEPTRIRSREWEARKMMYKERVREARLKAQIAVRLAEKEESRYYHHFGDLSDAESRFSDYDFTDSEESDSENAEEESSAGSPVKRK
jgi:hypothetical protein